MKIAVGVVTFVAFLQYGNFETIDDEEQKAKQTHTFTYECSEKSMSINTVKKWMITYKDTSLKDNKGWAKKITFHKPPKLYHLLTNC